MKVVCERVDGSVMGCCVDRTELRGMMSMWLADSRRRCLRSFLRRIIEEWLVGWLTISSTQIVVNETEVEWVVNLHLDGSREKWQEITYQQVED